MLCIIFQVFIYDGDELLMQAKVCGTDLTVTSISGVYTASLVRVHFRSDSYIEATGFQLSYTVDASGKLHA